MITIPPYLKKGSTIGITCPSGYMPAANAESCILTLQQWGYEVMVGKTLGSTSKNYFSAPDEDKIEELQAMLDDKNIHAILFGRGGYGMSRIIDQLDFKKFKKNPKWLIGFSDVTLMHSHVYANYNISSIHGSMAAAFNLKNNSPICVDSIKNCITGKKIKYSCESHPNNKQGTVTGKLVGGNLVLLSTAIGTTSAIDTKNKILFIEDIGEYLYSVDRMLQQLKRSGKLKNLAGLIVGGFTDMKDTDRPFGKSIEDIISDVVANYNYPVCFNFPISHGKENVAVKIGVDYELKITKNKTTLKEL